MDRYSMKCPNCSAPLELSDDRKTGKCPYCGVSYLLEKPGNDQEPSENSFVNKPHSGLFSVKLISCPDKIKAIKKFRELSGCGLSQAKNTIDNCPIKIQNDVSKSKAEETAKVFSDIGCMVEIIES